VWSFPYLFILFDVLDDTGDVPCITCFLIVTGSVIFTKTVIVTALEGQVWLFSLQTSQAIRVHSDWRSTHYERHIGFGLRYLASLLFVSGRGFKPSSHPVLFAMVSSHCSKVSLKFCSACAAVRRIVVTCALLITANTQSCLIQLRDNQP